MSDDHGPSGQPVPATPPQRRSAVVRVLMALFGAFLLLAGLILLFFMSAIGFAAIYPPMLVIWLICIAFSVGGYVLLVKASR